MPKLEIPNTETALEAAGYIYQNTSTCKGCGEEIAWYSTPTGGMIPLEEGTLDPHPTTCR